MELPQIRVEDLKAGDVVRYGGHVWDVDKVSRESALSKEGRAKYLVAVRMKWRSPTGNRQLGSRDANTFSVPAGTLFDRE